MNPRAGRFWTMDTYEGDQEDPLSIHKYLYCGASPVSRTDTSGHDFDYVSVLSTVTLMMMIVSHEGHTGSAIIYRAEMEFGGNSDFNDVAYYMDIAGILADTAMMGEAAVGLTEAGASIINWLRNLPENGAPVRGYISGYSRLMEITKLADAGSQTSAAEIRAAKFLRESGVNVHAQTPSGSRGPGTADFLIAGEKGTGRGGIPADVYAPGPTTPIKNILSNIAKKDNQAQVILVDLNRPGVKVTGDDLLQACAGDVTKWVREKLNSPNIQQVLVLPKVSQ